MENRLQRRPRSTSMKDRQNSKAQSDRTSSMESECSPDSRLVAQVQQHPDAAPPTRLDSASEIKIKRQDKNDFIHPGGEIQGGHTTHHSTLAHSTQ